MLSPDGAPRAGNRGATRETWSPTVTRQLRRNNLTADLLGDALDGAMGREHRTFLPGHEAREVVSGEVGPALRFVELGIGGLTFGVSVVGEGTEGVGDLAPADVDGLRKQMGTAGVKLLDG